jgi:hypothetical protein
MQRDFFDPSWEDTELVLVDAITLGKAECTIRSCEACNPEAAVYPFDHLLDQLTGHDPSVTDYLLAEPAHCPRCRGEVREKTLVECTETTQKSLLK